MVLYFMQSCHQLALDHFLLMIVLYCMQSCHQLAFLFFFFFDKLQFHSKQKMMGTLP